MKTCAFILLAIMWVTGCATKKPVDVEAARAAIQAADAEWALAAESRNAEVAASFLTADAVMIPPHEPALAGKGEIAAYMAELLSDPTFAIAWETTDVHVSGSGDIAYSLATNQIQIDMPDGSTLSDRGKGLTIWKKQADGTWKVAVDIFNSDATAEPTVIDTTGAAGQ
jgi:uncharacterized protein (TIGR02246 family)